MPEPSGEPTRRRFLELAATCAAGCAAASALGVATIAVVGTPLRAGAGTEQEWLDIGPLARFPDGGAVKLAILGERRDAWQRFPKRSLGNAVLVRRGPRVRVYSATCPHNGCDVIVEDADLLCPCHDSRFAIADGACTTGPSPRGLDPLPTKVEGGRVHVRFQRFEIGTPERKPL